MKNCLFILAFVLLTTTLGIGQTSSLRLIKTKQCVNGVLLPIIPGFTFDWTERNLQSLKKANPGFEKRVTPVMFSRTEVRVKIYYGLKAKNRDVLCFPWEVLR